MAEHEERARGEPRPAGEERTDADPRSASSDTGEAERLALIERLRETGLRLDREGRWWHEGRPVEHAGLSRALHRWLGRLEDGRYVLRLDADRYAYVEVEDAPYLVRTLELERTPVGVRVHVLLSDESEEELDYPSLTVGEGHALYCRVKGGLPARFSRAAYQLLGELVEEVPGGFALRAAGALWPIGER